MHPPFDFTPGAAAQTGRVALIVGGDGRIGAIVARAVASRGFAVAVHAHGSFRAVRDLAADLEGAGVPSLAVTANLRDEGAVRAMVHRVADHFGRIDALVTCVVLGRGSRFEEVAADEIRTQFDVCCVGAFVVAQETAGVMVRQAEGGVIVLVGDAAAAGPGGGFAGAALPTLVPKLAAELAARNPRVRVNAVLSCVGGPEAPPQEVPGRSAGPGHAAHAVLFLLENEAINGVLIPVAVAAGRSESGPHGTSATPVGQ